MNEVDFDVFGVLVARRVRWWVAAGGDSVDENLCRREGLVWEK